MKSFLHITYALLFILGMASCANVTEQDPNTPQEGKIVDGKKQGVFETLKGDKIANRISYKDGVRHGLTQDFYVSGKLRSDIMYINGVKNGDAIFYYGDGLTPYRVNNYVNGKREGLQRKYHKNGELLSELEYYNDHPGIGLVEYSKAGRKKSLGLKIIAEEKKSRGKKILRVHLSNDSQKVDFFVGKLTNEKYLNDQLRTINIGKGFGEIDLSKYKGQEINIIAKYETRFSNDFIKVMTYKVK